MLFASTQHSGSNQSRQKTRLSTRTSSKSMQLWRSATTRSTPKRCTGILQSKHSSASSTRAIAQRRTKLQRLVLRALWLLSTVWWSLTQGKLWAGLIERTQVSLLCSKISQSPESKEFSWRAAVLYFSVMMRWAKSKMTKNLSGKVCKLLARLELVLSFSPILEPWNLVDCQSVKNFSNSWPQFGLTPLLTTKGRSNRARAFMTWWPESLSLTASCFRSRYLLVKNLPKHKSSLSRLKNQRALQFK